MKGRRGAPPLMLSKRVICTPPRSRQWGAVGGRGGGRRRGRHRVRMAAKVLKRPAFWTCYSKLRKNYSKLLQQVCCRTAAVCCRTTANSAKLQQTAVANCYSKPLQKLSNIIRCGELCYYACLTRLSISVHSFLYFCLLSHVSCSQSSCKCKKQRARPPRRQMMKIP